MLRALFRRLGWTSGLPTVVVPVKLTPTSPIPNQNEVELPATVPLPPNKDAWEGWYPSYGGEGDHPLTMEAEIFYTDRDGQSTKRQITTKHFGPNGFEEGGGMMILAYCHLRQENRTFVTSRIKKLVNLTTGEIVQDIPPYLMRLYEASPAGQTTHLLDRMGDQLAILLFVARADGRISPKEKAYLIDFLKAKAPGIELDPEVLGVAFAERPSQAGVRRAMKVIIEQGKQAETLSFVEGLAAARSTQIDGFTAAAVLLVQKRFTKDVTVKNGKL